MLPTIKNSIEDRKRIQRYLARQRVVSLCVVDEGIAWCASCFYLFEAEKMQLFVMSDVKTTHGEIMQRNPHVAGTVAGQPKNIALIQGIQYQGVIVQLEGEAAAQARAAYCRRFPVATAFSAPVWCLSLHKVKMTDNTLGFAKKLQWQRE